ncbi:MAG: DUF1844 domain-containing protein [Planctomycetota bacterium]
MAADEPPKIIIDEDWKSQVEAERRAAKQPPSEPMAPAEAATPGSAPDDAAGPPGDDPEMPPASFELLLTTLATEAMMALGQMPHPVTGESRARPNQAKYLIDTIEVLRDKTAGNLGDAESQAVEGLLHQLRMAYVAATP